MQIPLQITCRHMDPSETVDALLREKVARLEQLFDRIVGCRVVIEPPEQSGHSGPCAVRVNLTIPGEEIVVNRASLAAGPGNLCTTIRDVFATVARQLKEHVARGHIYSRERD
jgi:ribosome-associated translation inhibitor RaiA